MKIVISVILFLFIASGKNKISQIQKDQEKVITEHTNPFLNIYFCIDDTDDTNIRFDTYTLSSEISSKSILNFITVKTVNICLNHITKQYLLPMQLDIPPPLFS